MVAGVAGSRCRRPLDDLRGAPGAVWLHAFPTLGFTRGQLSCSPRVRLVTGLERSREDHGALVHDVDLDAVWDQTYLARDRLVVATELPQSCGLIVHGSDCKAMTAAR